MSKSRYVTIVLVFGLVLGFLPAYAKTSQGGEKKEQAKSSASAGKVSRPFRIRLGGFSFGAGVSRFSGYYPYYAYRPYSFYRPWYYDPWYPPMAGFYSPMMFHPGWYTGFSRQDGMGEIRLRANLPDADVFIDDGLAGKAKDLKAIWLEPGAYNLKVEAADHAPFTVRLYVLSGKTVKVDANLAPQKEP
jgi:hypothetical protein